MKDCIRCRTSPVEHHRRFLVIDAADHSPAACVYAVDGGEAIAVYKSDLNLGEGGDFIAEEVVDPPTEDPPAGDGDGVDDDTTLEEAFDGDSPGEPDSPAGRDLPGTGEPEQQ